MKKVVVVLAVLALANAAFAAGYVPAGATGLWRFQDSANKMKATFGTDMVNSNPDNAAWMLGPWTMIGVPANAGLYADGGIVQDRAWDYMSCYHGISANGGGDYVNQYTIAMDVYTGGANWYSLYQTAWGGNSNDGDLWVAPDGTVGVGDVGYSTLALDQTKWHRIVLSVDTTSFFDVYVDGVQFLAGGATGLDGRFSLELDRFNLFADNDWEDSWILCGTVATWGRALSSAEVSQMGGWIGGSATPTELIIQIPEPATMSLLALGGIALLRRNRK
jgi:hypothetical protein